jgi:hypothetical protein
MIREEECKAKMWHFRYTGREKLFDGAGRNNSLTKNYYFKQKSSSSRRRQSCSAGKFIK